MLAVVSNQQYEWRAASKVVIVPSQDDTEQVK